MKRIKLFFLFIFSIIATSSYSEQQCSDSSRSCIIKAATAYLLALTTHDPTNVPLAANAKRWENGVNTGESADSIRYSLKNDIGFKTIRGIRDLRWIVDGQEVMASYLIDVIIPHSNIQTATTHVFERFKVHKGQIEEIEAVFCASMNPKPETSKMERSRHLSYFCMRSLI